MFISLLEIQFTRDLGWLWEKQKIRSPEPLQFVDSHWVVAVKGGNSTVYLNEKNREGYDKVEWRKS